MRRPDQVLRLFLGLTAAALLGVALAARANAADARGSAAAILGVLIAVLVVLLMFDLILWKMAIGMRRALSPSERISEWRVSPGTWEAFRTLDTARAAQTESHIHVFKPRADVPAVGVEVIASRGAIVADGVLLSLEPRGLGRMTGLQWLPGPPECLEFAVLVPSGGGPNTTIRTHPGLLRIPVEPSSRDAAVAAFQHFGTLHESNALSNPDGHRRMVRTSLALGVGLILLGAAAVLIYKLGVVAYSLPLVLTAVIGLTGGAGALFVAGVVWLVMLKR